MPPATRAEMKRVVKETGFMIRGLGVGGMSFGVVVDESRNGRGWLVDGKEGRRRVLVDKSIA